MKVFKILTALTVCIIAVLALGNSVQAATFRSDFELSIQHEKLIGNKINFRVVSSTGQQPTTCVTTIDGYALPITSCNFSVKLYEPRIYTAETHVYHGNGQIFTIEKPFAVEGSYLFSHPEKVSVNTPANFTVASKQFNVQQSPMFCSYYVDGQYVAPAMDCSAPLTFTTPGTHVVEAKMFVQFHQPMTLTKVVEVGS